MSIIDEFIKTCPTCGEEFEAKRTNQKYCSPSHKTIFNNHKAKQRRLITQSADKLLHKNRDILEYAYTLYGTDECEVTESFLSGLGFKFGYQNQLNVYPKTGTPIFRLYDYGLIKINNSDQYKIIKFNGKS